MNLTTIPKHLRQRCSCKHPLGEHTVHAPHGCIRLGCSCAYFRQWVPAGGASYEKTLPGTHEALMKPEAKPRPTYSEIEALRATLFD